MTRQTRFGLALLAVPVVVIVLAVSAWAVDAASSSGKVPRNTELAGHPIGALSPDALREQLAELTPALEDREVTIVTPNGTLTRSAVELGLTLDAQATVEAALAVEDDGNPALRPLRWVLSFSDPHEVEAVYVLDAAAFGAATADLQARNRKDPVEPNIRLTPEGFVVVPGQVGQALDVDALTTDLARAANHGPGPIAVEAALIETPPIHDDETASRVAEEATQLTAESLTISVGGKQATVEPTTLRSWLGTASGDAGLELTIDQAAIEADLGELVGDVGTPPVDVGFTLNPDGTIGITDGTAGTRCCAPDSVDRVVETLRAGSREVTLELVEAPPPHDRAWAEGLGIKEPIAEFTTNFPAGQPRVKNIHRMADLLRGHVIPPGEQLSINETIGRRTYDKGFVDAPVIYNGRMEKDVGGGVSQFATTLFNAAFYAGLDFGEYQSHSLYISRYPYGVEATLSYPHPDLQIRNTTPYGVMVWPTYTASSITLTLYSTKWVVGEQTGQTRSRQGNCTRVTTTRTRTYLDDGRQETDTVQALYRPGEGISC